MDYSYYPLPITPRQKQCKQIWYESNSSVFICVHLWFQIWNYSGSQLLTAQESVRYYPSVSIIAQANGIMMMANFCRGGFHQRIGHPTDNLNKPALASGWGGFIYLAGGCLFDLVKPAPTKKSIRQHHHGKSVSNSLRPLDLDSPKNQEYDKWALWCAFEV